MRMVGDSMRIGDSERDEAVSMLQEHHAAGRLSTEEFDERMGKALEARTASDLVGLFFDLPAPRPGLDLAAQPQPQPEPVVAPWAGAPQAPATWGADDDQLQHRPMARPWFAQWWIILPFVIMGTRGIWWIIPMVALWIWVIWPAIEQNRQRQFQIIHRHSSMERLKAFLLMFLILKLGINRLNNHAIHFLKLKLHLCQFL